MKHQGSDQLKACQCSQQSHCELQLTINTFEC